MSTKPKVALIGTGGTITSIGRHAMDLQNYSLGGKRLDPKGMLELFPDAADQADVIAVPYKTVPSPSIGPADWKELVVTMDKVVADHPDVAGIVILHGTATLEETAYALNLLAKVDVPVVVVGSQRPASALSTDAGMNLANAIRVAACPAARGMGVLVMLNDEIQSAREVTKTSTFRLQTFRSPDFGILGQVDGDSINFYRKPIRRHAPDTEFDIRDLDGLPRVDVDYAYAGADGTAVRAFVEAGAKGIVCAAFAPGNSTPDAFEALANAVSEGVAVVFSSRAGSGRVIALHGPAQAGIIGADNLNPQKARILLACALTKTNDPKEIERIFASY